MTTKIALIIGGAGQLGAGLVDSCVPQLCPSIEAPSL
jgi:hypothetical protein